MTGEEGTKVCLNELNKSSSSNYGLSGQVNNTEGNPNANGQSLIESVSSNSAESNSNNNNSLKDSNLNNSLLAKDVGNSGGGGGGSEIEAKKRNGQRLDSAASGSGCKDEEISNPEGFLSEEELAKAPKEHLLQLYTDLQKTIQTLKKDNAHLKESEEKYRLQQVESSRRENVLVMRLTTKEQDVQEYASQLAELKSSLASNSSSNLRSTLLDPAVNLIILRMKKELDETKKKLEDTQNDLNAWKFTPDSNTGKRLMAKCRMLYQENEDLGRIIASGRTAKLENDLALHKSLTEEMKKSQSEMDELIQELDEDVEGMQSTICFLQKELRGNKTNTNNANNASSSNSLVNVSSNNSNSLVVNILLSELCSTCRANHSEKLALTQPQLKLEAIEPAPPAEQNSPLITNSLNDERTLVIVNGAGEDENETSVLNNVLQKQQCLSTMNELPEENGSLSPPPSKRTKLINHSKNNSSDIDESPITSGSGDGTNSRNGSVEH